MNLATAINLKGNQRKIYQHLVRRGSISPMEAYVSHGIYRLSDVIHRLRKKGFRINTETRVDEAGHVYGRYRLIKVVH